MEMARATRTQKTDGPQARTLAFDCGLTPELCRALTGSRSTQGADAGSRSAGNAE
jgi:hypothetical protein